METTPTKCGSSSALPEGDANVDVVATRDQSAGWEHQQGWSGGQAFCYKSSQAIARTANTCSGLGLKPISLENKLEALAKLFKNK